MHVKKRSQVLTSLFLALSQVLGCDSLDHAPLLDLGLFLYMIHLAMI